MEKFTARELRDALRETGLATGDIVFFQSRLHALGIPEGIKNLKDKDEFCKFFLDALLDVIGAEGTLVVPTFTTQVARYDEPYIVEKTAPNYGLFPEYVVRQASFIRSLHPLVSVAATGARAREICRAGGVSAYGARSPFDMMARLKAKNLFLGLEVKDAVTMAHYMEVHYGVPYIYNKVLKWRPIEDGIVSGKFAIASVRYLDFNIRYDLERFQKDLDSRGVARKSKIGGGEICLVEMDDLLEVGYDGFDQTPYYLLAAPPDFDYGKIPYDGPSFEREKASAETPAAASSAAPEMLKATAPDFYSLFQLVAERACPEHRKALLESPELFNTQYHAVAEDIASALLKAAETRGVTLDMVAESFLKSAQDGKELSGIAAESFMYGSILAEVLHEDRWRLLRFARNNYFAPFFLTSGTHVEFGPGHGLFALLALRSGAKRAVLLGSNELQLKMTDILLRAQGIDATRWEKKLLRADENIPLESNSSCTFTAVDFMRNASSPAAMFKEAYRILRKGGAAYIMTEAVAAEAKEIRDMALGAGFIVEAEIETLSKIPGKIPPASYGAVLRKFKE